MPDNAELKEFIESVICPEIQSKINDTGNQICSFCQTIITGVHHCNGNPIYLPTIDQLIEVLGDRFIGLSRGITDGKVCFLCEWLNPSKLQINKGQSVRVVLAKAVKEILK